MSLWSHNWISTKNHSVHPVHSFHLTTTTIQHINYLNFSMLTKSDEAVSSIASHKPPTTLRFHTNRQHTSRKLNLNKYYPVITNSGFLLCPARIILSKTIALNIWLTDTYYMMSEDNLDSPISSCAEIFLGIILYKTKGEQTNFDLIRSYIINLKPIF